MAKTAVEHSRTEYDLSAHGTWPEIIAAGSLQRIATATEAMAKRQTGLMAEHDRYKRWYGAERERADGLERSNSALRGHITRLKRRVDNKPKQ